MGPAGGKGREVDKYVCIILRGFIHYITMVQNFPYLDEIFRDLNKNSKGKRPAIPPETRQEREQTAKGRKQQGREKLMAT